MFLQLYLDVLIKTYDNVIKYFSALRFVKSTQQTNKQTNKQTIYFLSFTANKYLFI